MSRREFLSLLSGAALTACAPHPHLARAEAPPERPRIRAVAFDLFTLFDPRGVDARVGSVLGGHPGFAATWKTKLFEYSWLRAASGQYRDFQGLVRDALAYATRFHRVSLTQPALEELGSAFTELEAWPDSKAVLGQLRDRGLKLAPLANFSPAMIRALVSRAGLAEAFDDLISTDRAQTYKPDPRAYALAETSFGLPRREIAFAAFGGWDASGGRWFGFPTFWVNRLGQTGEMLVAPQAQGPDLQHLVLWLSQSAGHAAGGDPRQRKR